MLQHHKESLENLKHYFSSQPETIAIVFGGSVAKGNERPDSDLDAMIVVSEEVYQRRVAENATAETIRGMCTYEGGYFDVKYMTKQYLAEAADKASEPTRNSFLKSRVIYSTDPEIEEIVSRIPVFQESEREDKMLSFYSNFFLNYGYFLKGCNADGYMRLHAIGEVIYSVYRMILQQNAILFPCNRRLEETVEQAPDKPENIVALGRQLAAEQTMEAADAFAAAFRAWNRWTPPDGGAGLLSRYVQDFEQWWRVPRPFINEW